MKVYRSGQEEAQLFLDEKDRQEIMKEVHTHVDRRFSQVGIQIDDSKIRDMQEDFIYLRRSREGQSKIKMHFLTSIISLIVAALAFLISSGLMEWAKHGGS